MFQAMVGTEPQTVDTYRREFDNHLRPKLGGKPLTKIVREDYEAIVAAMLAGYGRKPGGYSPKTIQNVLRLASRIHNYGKGRDPQWCATNAAEGVELPKVSEGEDIVHLTQAEVSKLLGAVAPERWAWGDWDALSDWELLDYALYLTGTMAGLRQGELIALRRRDLKWLLSKISVRKNRTRKHGDRTPKSAASRRDVPLPDVLGVVLDALLKRSRFTHEDARVFGNPETGDPISPKAMDERLEAHAKAAGIQRVTYHGLRHTFGTQCARAGTPMRTLKEWMGHARIATTERYARFAKDQNEVAMIENAFAPLSYSLSHSEANHGQVPATTAA
jgi:integrase